MTASNDRNGSVFTDEDLKVLKEGIVEDERDQVILRIANNVVYALIARLERSEDLIDFLEKYLRHTKMPETAKDLFDAWRKAAGKDRAACGEDAAKGDA